MGCYEPGAKAPNLVSIVASPLLVERIASWDLPGGKIPSVGSRAIQKLKVLPPIASELPFNSGVDGDKRV